MKPMAVLISMIAALAFAASALAQDEPRLALLIGNQDYPGDPPRLRRPHQDVAALETALESADFDVVVVRDADRNAIETAVEAFAERLREAGSTSVGFFYYAGHGAVATAQNQRRNFMLPAGGRFESEAAVAQRGVRLDLQIDALQTGRPGTLFVVYDACRNAFTREAGGRGFAVEVPRGGLLLAMSTMADATTPDDGAYAVALAAEIERSGQSAEVAFINASRAVGASRPINQLPTVSPALTSDFCFLRCTADNAMLAREPDPVVLATAGERLVFQAAAAPCEYAMFVRDFPGSPLVGLARLRSGGAEPCVATGPLPAVVDGTDADRVSEAADEEDVLGATSAVTGAPVSAGGELVPGTVFRDSFSSGGHGPEVVVVPAGSFTMGSPASEPWRDSDEGQQRTVTFSRAFAVGRFEVTRGQFAAFVDATGYGAGNRCATLEGSSWAPRDGASWRNPGFSQSDAHPVACVDWNAASAYAEWLSVETGQEYRLLSEAEWEYAARAGTTGRFSNRGGVASLCSIANHAAREGNWSYGNEACSDGVGRETAPVGSYVANRFGLYDMHGNVWEWVEDCFAPSNSAVQPSNGDAYTPPNCSRRVLRGGSWSNYPRRLRSADRNWSFPSGRYDSFGFRVARDLD